MTPIRFGVAERGMVGLFHPAGAPRATAQAVLLCPAFGQEAIRAHRMYRVLAERLARQGCAVLRFDYHCTGDSLGDGMDGELAGWTQDVQTAHRELVGRSGVQRVVWVGMRLGATLAAIAAGDTPPGLVRLVLWDPVTDGVGYLARLREAHVASIEKSFSLPLDPVPSVVAARDPASYNDEAMGFALSPRLREQLRGLQFEALWNGMATPCVAIGDPSDDDGRELLRLRAAQPARATLVELHHGTDWTSDTAENGTLLPTQALMQITQYAAGVA